MDEAVPRARFSVSGESVTVGCNQRGSERGFEPGRSAWRGCTDPRLLVASDSVWFPSDHFLASYCNLFNNFVI